MESEVVKLGIVLLTAFAAMFGFILYVVKWKLGQIAEGHKTLFVMVNNLNDRLREVELERARGSI